LAKSDGIDYAWQGFGGGAGEVSRLFAFSS
jgi:hypothetical protein